MTKFIEFKSNPEYWKKEYSGSKKNTVRIFDNPNDERLKITEEYLKGDLETLNIRIKNVQSEEIFLASITDISTMKFGPTTIFIYSWEEQTVMITDNYTNNSRDKNYADNYKFEADNFEYKMYELCYVKGCGRPAEWYDGVINLCDKCFWEWEKWLKRK
jgi:WD40 repeat protein